MTMSNESVEPEAPFHYTLGLRWKSGDGIEIPMIIILPVSLLISMLTVDREPPRPFGRRSLYYLSTFSLYRTHRTAFSHHHHHMPKKAHLQT